MFIRNEYRQLLLESWRYTQHEKGLEMYGWCIMTSHVHMIVGSKARPLDKIIGEMKSYTSRMLRKAIAEHPAESRREWMTFMMEKAGTQNSNNKEWQLWQQPDNPMEILHGDVLLQKLKHIHGNRVQSDFIEKRKTFL